VAKRSLRLGAIGLGIAIVLPSILAGFVGNLPTKVEAQQSWSLKMASPLEVGIVCLDIDRMLDFYTNVLGLKLVADAQTTPEMSAKLGATPEGYRIVRLQTPNGERIKLVQANVLPRKNQDPKWVFDRQGLAYITFIVADNYPNRYFDKDGEPMWKRLQEFPNKLIFRNLLQLGISIERV
jgi:catechol 2,3-dioxygenase-like lactoylglutathione lyase family enzyme